MVQINLVQEQLEWFHIIFLIIVLFIITIVSTIICGCCGKKDEEKQRGAAKEVKEPAKQAKDKSVNLDPPTTLIPAAALSLPALEKNTLPPKKSEKDEKPSSTRGQEKVPSKKSEQEKRPSKKSQCRVESLNTARSAKSGKSVKRAEGTHSDVDENAVEKAFPIVPIQVKAAQDMTGRYEQSDKLRTALSKSENVFQSAHTPTKPKHRQRPQLIYPVHRPAESTLPGPPNAGKTTTPHREAKSPDTTSSSPSLGAKISKAQQIKAVTRKRDVKKKVVEVPRQPDHTFFGIPRKMESYEVPQDVAAKLVPPAKESARKKNSDDQFKPDHTFYGIPPEMDYDPDRQK